MKQIKTIQCRLDREEYFDKEVNKALRDGWELKTRRVLPPYEGQSYIHHRTLYAELEKETESDEGEKAQTVPTP